MSETGLFLGNAKPDPRGKFPILMSYALVRDDPELNTGEEIRLIDYMAFLRRWEHKLFGYLALDMIGDPTGTDRNLQIMLDAGLRPIPVHVRGDDQDRMDRLFELSDWVACGGLRRPHAGHCSKAYVKQKMAWAAGRNVHWLGYTSPPMTRAFRPYSCDCSNWSAGARWGRMQFYYGGMTWGRTMANVDSSFSKAEVRLLEEIGMTPAHVRDPVNRAGWTKDTLHRHAPFMTTCWSWVKYIRDVRAMIGTRVFAAVSPFGMEAPLLEMIDRSAPR